MILFDPDQSEAADGFAELAGALPTRRTLLKHLRAAQAAVRLKGEVTVLLTTDAGIRGLNRRFRKKNKATDVLSFPAQPGFGVAGDLAISVDTAGRQAAEHGHALGVELRVLMLHGMLHLAGMDHETDDGAMARREGKLRAKLKLPLGLIERVEGGSVTGRRVKQIPLKGNDSQNDKSKGNGKNKSAVGEVSVIPTLSQKARKDGAPASVVARAEKQIPLKGNDRKKSKGNSKSNSKDNGKNNSKDNDKNNGKSKSNHRSFDCASPTARSAQDDRSLRSGKKDDRSRGGVKVAR